MQLQQDAASRANEGEPTEQAYILLEQCKRLFLLESLKDRMIAELRKKLNDSTPIMEKASALSEKYPQIVGALQERTDEINALKEHLARAQQEAEAVKRTIEEEHEQQIQTVLQLQKEELQKEHEAQLAAKIQAVQESSFGAEQLQRELYERFEKEKGQLQAQHEEVLGKAAEEIRGKDAEINRLQLALKSAASEDEGSPPFFLILFFLIPLFSLLFLQPILGERPSRCWKPPKGSGRRSTESLRSSSTRLGCLLLCATQTPRNQRRAWGPRRSDSERSYSS